jgi:hypothetical protein
MYILIIIAGAHVGPPHHYNRTRERAGGESERTTPVPPLVYTISREKEEERAEGFPSTIYVHRLLLLRQISQSVETS